MGLFSFSRKTDNLDDGALDAQDSAEAGSSRGRTRKRQKANEPVDPVLPEKQRARRRLVGAVALVLAAVIGLPMVLDPEPKPLAHDIAIDIPSKDDKASRAATRAVPADVPAAASLDKQEELVTPDSGSAAVAPPAARETVARDSADTKPKEPPAAVAKAADKPSTAPAPGAGTPSSTASAAPAARAPATPSTGKSAAEIAAEEARVKALLAGKPDPAAGKAHQTADKPERFAVQVAALGSPEKVKELQNKLRAAGIQSHTQKVATAGGEVIRVRVGPVEGRNEAEKLRQKLVKLGLNGTLVPV